MKKLILAAMLLTLSITSFAKEDVHTISTECGYFTGTAEECKEFLDICFN